ncbi:MAG: flagellar biosynthesis protein FlhF [Geobacteraceae bacterium]|nr:flagellar biosynthesis protein FlhF [Geobacteraceae bacterium]
MQTRTFQAANMAEAMQMVKAELGPDAMIISSRKERRKGILGFFTKPVFRITATADTSSQRQSVPYREESGRDETTRDEFRKSMIEPLARELKDLRARVESLLDKDAAAGKAPVTAASPVMAEKSIVAAGEFSQRDPVESEMSELKKLLLESVQEVAGGSFSGLPGNSRMPGGDFACASPERGKKEIVSLAQVSATLHEAGLVEGSIHALLEKVKTSGQQIDDEEDLRQSLREAVESTIKCSGPIRMKKNGTKIVALVGPTGVGKTTTIAKLAAHYTVGRKVKIALVTIDTFRVGAVEQLKTYSRIMGVPLEVASTPKDLEKALAAHTDKDLILIDTVGRSPKDKETIEGLYKMLDSSFSIETHLCVAATTRERELRGIVESFSVLPLSRLLFTKLDESSSFGSIVNLQIENKLPLSYLTRGQRVPEDIEPATGKKVAELIFGEE